MRAPVSRRRLKSEPDMCIKNPRADRVMPALAALLVSPLAAGQTLTLTPAGIPIGGFQPQVGFTLTNQFASENQADLFFVAQNSTSYNPARALPGPGADVFRVALLDSGAQANVFQDEAYRAFGIGPAGFDGTTQIPLAGVGGQELARVSDPLGVFVGGLQDATVSAGGFTLGNPDLAGQTSVAVATLGPDSALPNVIGLPTISEYTTVIRNSEPQFFENTGPQAGTVLTPSVLLLPNGTGAEQGLTRRAGATLEFSPLATSQDPYYVFNVESILSGGDLSDNPSTPTLVAGAVFVDLDVTENGISREADVFFDTGAQVTVLSETFASRLGFDAQLDAPDFSVPILGAGGSLTEVPGFVLDELVLPASGGAFRATDVPVVVLDVPDPRGTSTVDGILGTNVFWDRDLALDPAAGRLYISDPVIGVNRYAAHGGLSDANLASSWSRGAVPGELDSVDLINHSRSATEIFLDLPRAARLVVGGNPAAPAATTEVLLGGPTAVSGTIEIGPGGSIFTNAGLTAQQVNVAEGGTLRSFSLLLRVNGEVNNRGTVAPLAVQGDFYQLSTGTLGADSGLPTMVSGTASLGGRVEVSLDSTTGRGVGGENFYRPFTVLEAGRVVGRFDRVEVVRQLETDARLGVALAYGAEAVTGTSAYLGDANLDRSVNLADFARLAGSFGSSGRLWTDGDFDGNGTVNLSDFAALASNFGIIAASAVGADAGVSADPSDLVLVIGIDGTLTLEAAGAGVEILAFEVASGSGVLRAAADEDSGFLSIATATAQNVNGYAPLGGGGIHVHALTLGATDLAAASPSDLVFRWVDAAFNVHDSTSGGAVIRVVPEPGTALLLLAGGAVALRRRA